MGDAGDYTAFEAITAQIPMGSKGSSFFFPTLTDGVIIDKEQTDQARIPLDLGTVSQGKALAAFCERHGLSVLSVLNVAWAMVLSAYADTEAIGFLFVRFVAGVPHVGVYQAEIDGGKSVLKTLVDAEEKLQASVSSSALMTPAEFQELSARAGGPAFNSVVMLYDGESPEREQPGNYLAIHARYLQDQFVVDLQCPTSLIPASQATHCAATLSHVLGEIIKAPRTPLSEVSLMSQDGMHQIWEWNKRMPEVVSRCLHHLIDERARKEPEALAIQGPDGCMTYGELQALTDRLAHSLVDRGVGPEVAVPLFFEKSKWAIVTMIAVVKAGGAIVNLDAKQPRSRLMEIMEQLQAPLILTSQQYESLWQDNRNVFSVHQESVMALPAQKASPAVAVTPKNILYIIFTSGSTGTPKGCVVEHESFLTAAIQHVTAGEIDPTSRILQMTPYTFDVSMLEIFTTLTTGACVCFPSDELAQHGIAHIINALRITWTFMTPSVVRLVDPADVPTLKTLALGGEALSQVDVTTWAGKLHLINGYGPSECSVAATINPHLTPAADPANIGRGYGAVCWVVHPDDHNRLVPIGAVGELLIQGPIVARGYLNEPAKTEAVFLDEAPVFLQNMTSKPAPFRFYKTGDLVRNNSDGTISFIGRKDRQVKLRGQRLELGEIEQRLSVDPTVRHARVLLPKAGPWATRRDVHELLIDQRKQARGFIPEISTRLAAQVPGYMVPTFWVVVAALPFTTSGKVNGVVLNQWVRDMDEDTYNEVAGIMEEEEETSETVQLSEMELLLQEIWAEELGLPLPKLKYNRSFIALGGDSITAMKVVARCRREQLKVSVLDVVRAKSLIDLASKTVRSSQVSVEEDTVIAPASTPAERTAAIDDALLSKAGLSSKDDVEDVYGCSPVQDGILLSQVKFPGTYEIRRVLKVLSIMDANTTILGLQRAWQGVVDRHQSLRSIFVDAGGIFQQIVLKNITASVYCCEYMCSDDEVEVTKFLKSLPSPTYNPSEPQHHLTICRTRGDNVYMMVELSHAIVDGGSTEVVLQEMSLAFDGKSFTEPASLYSDYIHYISSPEHSQGESMSHWTGYLAGVQPTIVPMYPRDGASKQIRSVKVPFAGMKDLLKFSVAHGVTIANVIQTAWALVLRAYTGSDDVCFGYVASGRDVPVKGIENAVGAFINMLVCRVRLDQHQAALDAVDTMQSDYFTALAHQHCSLAQIQHGLNLSGMPLFNSIISLQKGVPDQQFGDALSFRAVEEDDPTDFDLAVAIDITTEDVEISIGYWSSLLTQGDAMNLANTFSAAIYGIVDQAGVKPADINLFNDQDRAQIFEWNKAEPVAESGCVHEYFYEQVKKQPDAQAVCAWDGEYTYSQLDVLSEKLAHHLAKLGAGPEVLIPHCFEKSKLATVTMVAIMKSGGAGVGLSSAHPLSRIQDILDGCQARVAVVSAQHAKLLEGLVEHIVVVDESFLDELPAPTDNCTLPQAQPSNPAFVSFTSGSTGKPKGIVLEHRSLITSIQAHGSEWGVGPGSRVLQFSAYAFDASVSDTFTTLTRGGTVCIPCEKDRVDDLAGAINKLGVNWAFLTPRVLGLLSPETVPTLKTVVLGGEAISREDISPWTDALELRIVYGPTECTIYSMGTDPLTADSDPAGLGHAVGTRLWVTDPENTNKLLPVGCIGELVIEGPLVTRGYLNEPEKTKAAFFEDPAWLPKPENGQPRRFYKTSDLVRYYPDGQLRFIGRKDTQIKVRGQRVELGEIEHAILENLPGAAHVTVDSVVLPQQTLVAFLKMENAFPTENELFVPLSAEFTVELRALEKVLSETLPVYMLPSLFIPISHIPMTISGKVDRIALRRAVPGLSHEQMEMYALANQDKAAPQTKEEEQLQTLWAAVLGKDPNVVGRNDNFFRLGGDSIGAMKLVVATREANLLLTVADIFRYPELSQMAQRVELVKADEQENVYEPFSMLKNATNTDALLEEAAGHCSIARSDIQDVYPCTPLQEGVFSMSNTHTGSYVAQSAFRLPAGFDMQRFKDAWQTLVDAHSILRTRIVTIGSTSYQVVLTEDASKLEWQQGSSLEEYLQRDHAIAVTSGTPLARYAIVEDGESSVFVWTAHHAVYDGWTVPLLFEQLEQAYTGSFKPSTAPSYAQFVEYVQETDPEASQEFWRSMAPQEPPSSFPRLPYATYQPRAKKTCHRDVEVALESGSSLTMAILLRAAWAIVMARYTDSEDILYGLTLSGRDALVPHIEGIVGPTITTVPMNVHLDPKTSLQSFLESQHEQNVEMMNFQHVGLRNIRQISPQVLAATDFTNLFVVQPKADGRRAFAELEIVPTDMTEFDPYALVVECNLGDGSVHLEARVDDDVLSVDLTEKLLGHFEHVLRQIIRPSADVKLGDIDLFSKEDEKQIWEWNAVAPTAVNECVHEKISQQATLNPGNMAIEAWDGSLTYGELDELSSRLAYHLSTEYSVKPETLLPLCFDKSAWTVLTMVAVVKAGGACVMLNPDHPVTRLQALIEDTGSHLVLTSPQHQGLFGSVSASVVPITKTLIQELPPVSTSQRASLQVQPTNPVFMIFTSGSTGKPKGIIVQHNSVCTVAAQHGEGLGFGGPGSRVLQFASYSFDVSMGETFFTLMKGGTLCIPTEHDRVNNLAGVINSMQITWTFMAPTVAALVDPKEVPHLKTLVLGGEAVSQSLVDRWASQVHMIDSYGPAECTIWASHANPSATVSPANIGSGTACRYWVVETSDYNRLAPVGCVGELLIEGPNVSRGYLNEPEKTRDAFVENPAWMHGKETPQYKFYRTGDLVRYNPDGTLNIAGRKDSQVKFHGQRIELGEIEFHLRAQKAVEAGMVTLPKTGPCKGKLVAVVALADLQPLALEGDCVELVSDDAKSTAQPLIMEIEEELTSVLPSYMVPSVWIVLDSIPLTASRKINRVPITRWVTSITEDTYRRIVNISSASVNLPTTALEKQLAQVWSQVLNIPEKSIGLNRSFMSLGGDSITAMQIVSRCRAVGIKLSVQDILLPKSLAAVVSRASSAGDRAVTRQETYDVPFSLSPIQKVYFNDVVRQATEHHYNQSVLLRLTRPVSTAAVASAIEQIVARNSMLRAKFIRSDNGEWSQMVQSQSNGSFKIGFHSAASRQQMLDVINSSQRNVDIENGPIFVVDHFSLRDEERGESSFDCREGQLISLVAHHLVVDAVSWHVIVAQLEASLLSESSSPHAPMPFHNWAQEQCHFGEQLVSKSVLPNDIPPANLSYWGMQELPTWKNVEEVRFTIDENTTSLLLGAANTALRTEPIDILLGAIQQSFNQTFTDRAVPAIFSEGHGREPWDSSIDLSETVGWFTTFYPVHRRMRKDESVKDTIKRTKDVRRSFTDNGFSYFTCRHYSAEGRKAFNDHRAMEICFNYLGQTQQLERSDALLKKEPLRADEEIQNISEGMGRLAVFDISAAISFGQLGVSFFFNRDTDRQEQIRDWVKRCEKAIQYAAQALVASSVEHTLSDFPLMKISYPALSNFTNTVLPALGISPDNVEDLYPCSPIQEGILLSQTRQPGTYEVRQLFEVVPRSDVGAVDLPRLLKAWQQTVDRHSILRTVFIGSLSGDGVYDQLVLRSYQATVQHLTFSGTDVVSLFQGQQSPDYTKPVPGHRLTICEGPESIYCQIELSHTLVDGTSLALLVRDFVSAYESTLPSGPGPLYSEYVRYLDSLSKPASLKYWADRLTGAQPCHFPNMRIGNGDSGSETKTFNDMLIHIDEDGKLQRFCESQSITMSNLVQAAWGMVLRAYTSKEDVMFGYMASGRDVPLDGIYDAVGPFINLLVCRLHLVDDLSVYKLLKDIQLSYMSSLPHQQTSLAAIQHELGNKDVALFNTVLSLQRQPSQGPPPQVDFHIVDQADPTEYDISLCITTHDVPGVEIHMTYLTAILSNSQADELMQAFTNVLGTLADTPEMSLSSVDVISHSRGEELQRLKDVSRTLNGRTFDLASIQNRLTMALLDTEDAVVEVISLDQLGGRQCMAVFHAEVNDTRAEVSLLPITDGPRAKFTDLKETLARHLPEELIPTLYFPVNGLPLERAALQKLVDGLNEQQLKQYQLVTVQECAALTANEKIMLALWADVLDISDSSTVNPSDSFFRLGGDSIGAMRLVAAARNQGLVLTINSVFQKPTLSAMATELSLLDQSEEHQLEPFSLLPSQLDPEQLATEAASLCGISRTAVEDIYPCTPLQEGLMVLNRQHAASYTNQTVFAIPDTLDLPRFKKAWEKVAERSTILRTRMVNASDGLFQVVLKQTMTWESAHDLDAYLKQDSSNPIDYGQPMARYAIVSAPTQKYFVWTAHHSIYDGMTIPILTKQVSAEYNSEMALPEVPYNRFIQYIRATNPESATEFWTAQFAEPSLTYPTLQDRTYQPYPNNSTISSVHLSRQPSDITFTTILKAAWAFVLAGLTETEKVTFGITVSGRNAALPGINQVVGPTIATVPVSIAVDGSQPPLDFLRSIQQQNLDMVPFEHTGLQNIRLMSEQAKEAVEFQNLLVIQPNTAPFKPSDFLGLTNVAVDRGDDQDPYALIIECNILDDGAEIKALFDENVISSEEVKRIISRYSRAIERLSSIQEAGGDENINTLEEIGTISEEDLQQILEWNRDRPETIQSCVHYQFEEQVRRQPDALAVSSYDVELTYSQLNMLAEKLAHELISRGVKQEMIIPLVFNKCSWTIIAMLAVMKAGGVCCMFNPEHPRDRIQLLLDDLDASLVVCDQASSAMLSSLLPPSGVLPIGGDYLDSLPCPNEPVGAIAQPSNAVFIVYTSGSTGKPKGSILEHRSLVTGLVAHLSEMSVGPGTRAFQFASYTFDVSFDEIIGTLMLGGCVCVPSEYERMNALTDAMAKYRVTWTELTTTVASLLVPSSIPTLKTLVLSGEPLTKEVVNLWSDHVQIINSYGPSECCVCTTCNSQTSTIKDPTNIGRGLGCTLWVVDPDNIDRLLPIGSTGELLIEGPIVARGYLNEPEKTAAAFINPPNGGFLTTKAMVACTARVIWSDTTAMEASNSSAAKTPSLKILTAFICAPETASGDVDSLLVPLSGPLRRSFQALHTRLLEVLPKHMVPQLFIPVSHMPLSPSRKLDRKVLRTVGNGLSPETLASYALSKVDKKAPSTETEKALAQLWARVLGTDSIGVDDHFFHLGGDSIAAMKLVAAGSKAGLSMSVADVTNYPKLNQMAENIDGSLSRKKTSDAPPEPFSLLPDDQVKDLVAQATTQCAVDANVIEDMYPCTSSQEALMALTAKDETAYVSRLVFRLPVDINLEKYQQAWESLAQLQPIMRTRIIYTDDSKSFQVVIAEPLVWRWESSVEDYVRADKLSPMVHGQPLMRNAIVPGDEHDPRPCLIHTSHHAVYDGWSQGFMFEQVGIIYREGLSALPPVIPYSKFIQHLATTDREESEEFWRSQIEGNLPAQFPTSAHSAQSLRPNQTRSLHIRLPQRDNLTFTTPTVLKSAWSLLLSRYTTSDDIVFGHVLSGRSTSLRGAADIMGPMIATVPIRVRLDRAQTIEELMGGIQQQALDMTPFEQFGLQNIRRIQPNGSAIADFGHLFIIQPILEDSENDLDLEQVSSVQFDFDTYPLIIECHLGDSELDVRVRYDDMLIPEQQMGWLLQHYENLIHQLFRLPQNTLMVDITMTGQTDVDQLLDWMGAPIEPVNARVHDLFSVQSRFHPQRKAVDAWDGSLTYQELDHLSSRFSDTLVKLGVTAGCTVGWCFDKSKWAIVSQLAVLKAGGACVNLNPEDPVSRLTEIVHDTGIDHVITAPQYADLAAAIGSSHVVIADTTTASEVAATSADLPRARTAVDPSSPAYLAFTSDSTGKPKIMAIDHRAICTSIRNHGAALKITSKSRVLQSAAYTSDISYAEIFTTLLSGGTVCVISEHGQTKDLAAAIDRVGANWACLTPNVANSMRPTDVPKLKTLVLSGECPSQDNLQVWAGKVDTLLNAYGSSEASVWCAVSQFTHPKDSFANIGFPVGCRLWVTEPEDVNKLAPLGCLGELVIEGPILSEGYLGQPKASEVAFIDRPDWMQHTYPADGFARVYRTGDMVKFNVNGSIEYLGRKDTQLKMYGQRIDPREIEHSIKSHIPSTYDVLVDTTLVSSRNRNMLVAYLYDESVQSPDVEIDSLADTMTTNLQQELTTVQSALHTSVPHYLQPILFIPLKTMPTDSLGKADRNLLSRMVDSLSDAQLQTFSLATAGKRPPKTEMELTLASLWANVLMIDRESIGADDSFFALGGDSIVAMKLVSLARASKIFVSVADIFNHPSLVDIAALATANAPVTPGDGTPVLSPSKGSSTCDSSLLDAIAAKVGVEEGHVEEICPTTSMQEIALIGAMTRPRWMLNYFYFESSDPVDVDRLRQGCFDWYGILRQLDPVFLVIPTDDLDETTQRVYEEGKAGNLQIENPFVQFVLAQQRRGHAHRLIMRISHAQYDGVSLPTIWEALQKAYTGQTLPSSPPFSTFTSFCPASDDPAAIEHWRSLLAGSTMTNFVERHKPGLRDDSDEVLSVRRRVPNTTLTSDGITFATVAKSAWALVLARMAARPDVVFGHTISGRNLAIDNIDRIVGPCLNVVPVRAQFQDRWTVMDLLRTIQNQQVANMPFESLGLRPIVEQCTDWPRWMRFSSVIQHQNIEPDRAMMMGDGSYEPGFIGSELDLMDVSILSTPAGDHVDIDLITATSVMSAIQAEDLLDQLCLTIRFFSSSPSTTFLPSVEELEAGQPLIPMVRESTVPDIIIGAPPADSSEPKVAALREAVHQAWTETLPSTNKSVVSPTECYFAAGGELVGLSRVLLRLQEHAPQLRLEDLLHHSSMEQMVNLLYTHTP
ncbi:nonribosomal peptide synthase [Aspergillus nomiae NRRL 13137]|uniref:Nonribosomal peptide synthase n=1 Tax=Aspergillus nomiae NRRL (strain ATCC 15546 / NRRL 13137 / CBS 260.88 / M93) TaxID=1509407 RepID=A0A0L1JCG1_ASPN3|nr:nonribosomal peptide synthase [Aspergillus nomiae NRRL 13137]KNG89441.1 nonribosomal peptide synthase [Aspergillus nomiae NRRL 13137]